MGADRQRRVDIKPADIAKEVSTMMSGDIEFVQRCRSTIYYDSVEDEVKSLNLILKSLKRIKEGSPESVFVLPGEKMGAYIKKILYLYRKEDGHVKVTTSETDAKQQKQLRPVIERTTPVVSDSRTVVVKAADKTR